MDGYLKLKHLNQVDISHQDKATRTICLVLLLSFLQCQNDNNNTRFQYNIFKMHSINPSGSAVYYNVLSSAKDSLSVWINSNLTIVKPYKSTNWKLDSLVCFNTNVDRCVMSVYHQYGKSTNNSVRYLYGAKIERSWYFFWGASIYAFSEFYGYAPKTPLPFSKLQEIAIDNIFHGYLKKKNKGFWRNLFGKTEWEINEAWFKAHFEGPGWDRNCLTRECYEKLYLAKVQNNWKHRDTTNYKQPSSQ